MKNLVLLIMLFFVSFGNALAQENINDYKYVIIPDQFTFLKSPDQHQLNSLTKFLFDREGFNVVSTGVSFPQDLAANGCLGLRVDVIDASGMFSTKLFIQLTNCQNEIVFKSKDGLSREKDYKKAYHEAIRAAFQEFETMEYAYNGSSAVPKPKVVIEKPVEEKVELAFEPKKIEKKELIVAKKNDVISQTKEKSAPKETKLIKLEPAVKAENKKLKKEKKAQEKSIKKEQNNVEAITEKATFTIEGRFSIENWGISEISKKADHYVVRGGDENFAFATIYATSKPSMFIIKWVAFKQPQLAQLDAQGNLKVDSTEGIVTYKRVN